MKDRRKMVKELLNHDLEVNGDNTGMLLMLAFMDDDAVGEYYCNYFNIA